MGSLSRKPGPFTSPATGGDTLNALKQESEFWLHDLGPVIFLLCASVNLQNGEENPSSVGLLGR